MLPGYGKILKMSWALKGLSGPLENKITPLKDGLTLGRQGDVAIPDTKASSIHARINQAPSGQWLIHDNNSKNGTRVKTERIETIALLVGMVFYIGDQGFEVIDLTPKKREVPRAEPPPARAGAPSVAPPPVPVVATVAIPEVKQARYWHELLAEFMTSKKGSFAEEKRPVAAMEPALVLDFVRGLQANSRWVLGYGPRKIGSTALDLPIWEPGAPTVCFEVSPTHEGILFKTTHPEIVQLNGQGVDSQVLRVGDTIRILETIIEVDFIE